MGISLFLPGIPFLFANECAIIHSKGCDKHGEGMQRKAIERLIALFDRYRYTYHFNRRNIADMFVISENAGSRFLKACMERNIIHKVKTDEYCFVVTKE